RDLVSRLPLSLTFLDFAGAEKIAVLDRKLATDGGGAAADGDVAYFAPWGNLALFYRGLGTAGGGLVILGAITAGKDRLAALPEGATVTLEALP
ncbi:MAG: hypothetical protein LIP77_05670, partial [Planctomycetes bacterium]|nr:hypothetical protein [Planctomycetota bacterium]